MNKAVATTWIFIVFSLGNVLGNHQPSMMASPMGRPPSAGMRSASMMASPMGRPPQPLPAPPPPASNGGPAMMGQRQASQPALMMNGQPRVTNGEDQGYYQNIGTAHLQQPMPLRYNNGGGPVPSQQRFGSQSSLQQQVRKHALKI